MRADNPTQAKRRLEWGTQPLVADKERMRLVQSPLPSCVTTISLAITQGP
jgi:hypothetical protein